MVLSRRLAGFGQIAVSIQQMGNSPCLADEPEHQEERIEVKSILDDFPQVQRNCMFRGSSNRYSDLSVINENYNRYIFVLKIDGQHEVRVVLPVINEFSHRALHPNYKLIIGKDMIIDPFEEKLESCLAPARNDMSGLEYSIRVVPFRGYNSLAFKRVLEEVWIYQNIQKHFERYKRDKNLQDPRLLFVWLEDCFIYGINSDQQAVILLYDRVQTSLALTADYRLKSGRAWKTSQRLKIERDLFMGCIRLKELGIVHRDIRPSNIYYSEKHQRFLLGGFSCAREVINEQEEDLMTVSGIELQNEGKVRELIANKQSMGLYRASVLVYNQLQLINRLLQSRRIVDQLGPSTFKERVFSNIESMLLDRQPLDNILKTIEGSLKGVDRTGQLAEEANIAKGMYKILPQRQKDLSEVFLFNIYCALGYQIEFSEMAHKMIERNNLEGHPFANAKILKELGEVYQKNGASGSEYMLNACVLYCKEADLSMEKQLYDDAKTHLEQGEEVYIMMSSAGDFEQTMIELKRLRAELRARTLWQLVGDARDNQKKEILQLMSKTLDLAADLNLPIERQMKLFLTWGIVHRQCGDREAAEERFKNGLAVCQNSGAFQNQQAALLMRSHFLYEFCLMKFQQLQDQHDPLLSQDKQSYRPEDLPKTIENQLREALQIREKQSTRPYQAAQCCILLGKLYMLESEYLQAKVQFKRALIRLMDLQRTEKIFHENLVNVHYDLGSVSYKLQDYQEAVDHYREAITILQNQRGDNYWTNVIAGNLGLAYMRAGLVERGKTLLEKSKEAIRLEHGAHHYDFLFLTSQQQLISHDTIG